MTTLVWLRDDLRLADHPALNAAAQDPDGIVVLYVLEDASEHVRPLGGATRWWLHHSLVALRSSFEQHGIELVLRRGAAETVVPAVARESGADRVLWNRRYNEARAHDAHIKTALRAAGIKAHSTPGDLLFEPWHIANGEGNPYRVYSAFWRACTSGLPPAAPLGPPDTLTAAAASVDSDALESWGLLPHAPDWSGGLAERWTPGEHAALDKLTTFLADGAQHYSRRDFPAERTGSELSPHLRWGEISPRQVWHEALRAGGDVGLFLSELGWREFAKHTAYHFGPLASRSLDTRFETFPWREVDADELRAWQQGRTGFGIVDAGMQELWQTGFMHNRVRMIAASLFTKNLRFDWRVGEAWFWDTLVDADDASNPFNWQWVAGCGADAAPYFRVFNPDLQQKKFDPEGRYVDRWAPYSAGLPRILDLKASRAEALQAYQSITR